MQSMNISLPLTMAEYIRRQVDEKYGNVSEFFRDLVRQRVEREIEADLALLASTGAGAAPGPSEKEIKEILTVQRRVRRARRARRV